MAQILNRGMLVVRRALGAPLGLALLVVLIAAIAVEEIHDRLLNPTSSSRSYSDWRSTTSSQATSTRQRSKNCWKSRTTPCQIACKGWMSQTTPKRKRRSSV